MPDNTGGYIAQGLLGFAQGYQQSLENKRKQKLEEDKLHEIQMDNIAKEYAAGLERGEDGKLRPLNGYLDPEADTYKAFNRKSELKAMESPKSSAMGSPLTIRQAHSIRGLKLPAELEAVGDQPFDYRYANLFPSSAKTGDRMKAKDLFAMQGKPVPANVDPEMEVSSSFLNAIPKPETAPPSVDYGTIKGLKEGTLPNEAKIPTSIASLAIPKPVTNSQALASNPQRASYARMMGVPFEATEGLTVGQFAAGVSNVRGQQAAGDRQAKALGQSERHFNANLDFQSKKEVESQLEKFRDDYAKTGIPTALPIFDKLDKLTGIISSEKPNLSKLPGVTTNTLRSIPLIGNAAGSMSAKRYGGGEEYQLLQRLLNADIRNLSGQAVTKYEEGRTLVASGMGPGANEKDVVRGVRLMYDALKGADQDVRAAYPVEVTSMYESRGGNKPLQGSAANGQMNPSAARAQKSSASKLGISQDKLDAINKIPNPPGQASGGGGGGKKVAKKLYSPSRNQTKIVYADGTEETVNGKK